MSNAKIQEAVNAILNKSESSKDIIQTLSKSELDEVEEVLFCVGMKIVSEQLAKAQPGKAGTYAVPGVTSSGHIPEGHPERQLIVDHINKLNNLPESHPLKNVARNVARALHERHIGGDKVINNEAVASPTAVKPEATRTLDYKQINPDLNRPQVPPTKPEAQLGDTDVAAYQRKVRAEDAMNAFNTKPTK